MTRDELITRLLEASPGVSGFMKRGIATAKNLVNPIPNLRAAAELHKWSPSNAATRITAYATKADKTRLRQAKTSAGSATGYTQGLAKEAKSARNVHLRHAAYKIGGLTVAGGAAVAGVGTVAKKIKRDQTDFPLEPRFQSPSRLQSSSMRYESKLSETDRVILAEKIYQVALQTL